MERPLILLDGVHPGKVPSREDLDALTEDDLFKIVHYWQEQNFTHVGAQFWIDELSRRCTQGHRLVSRR